MKYVLMSIFSLQIVILAEGLSTKRAIDRVAFKETMYLTLDNTRLPLFIREYGIFEEIPKIGHYEAGYPMRKNYIFIRFDPKKLPNDIKRLITQQSQIFSQIMLYGPFDQRDISGNFPPQYQENNILFHGFGHTFTKQTHFNVNIPMGIFHPDGITPISPLKTNVLSAVSVHVHAAQNGIAFSPKTAEFTITPNRNISTFWSIATSPNAQYTTVTYHILINNLDLMNKIYPLIDNSITLGDLINNLKTISGTSTQDQRAFNNGLQLILEIAQETSLNMLADALSNLSSNLVKLKNHLSPSNM